VPTPVANNRRTRAGTKVRVIGASRGIPFWVDRPIATLDVCHGAVFWDSSAIETVPW
jgi:hypothetical protein